MEYLKSNAMKWMISLSSLLCVMVVGLGATSASEPAIGDERLKAVIKEVIRENPKLILDTLNQYTREQKEKQEEQLFEAGFKNR